MKSLIMLALLVLTSQAHAQRDDRVKLFETDKTFSITHSENFELVCNIVFEFGPGQKFEHQIWVDTDFEDEEGQKTFRDATQFSKVITERLEKTTGKRVVGGESLVLGATIGSCKDCFDIFLGDFVANRPEPVITGLVSIKGKQLTDKIMFKNQFKTSGRGTCQANEVP